MRHPFDLEIADLQEIESRIEELTPEETETVTGGLTLITTYVVGEEGGRNPIKITTMAVGEEGGGFTTLALGEEGGSRIGFR